MSKKQSPKTYFPNINRFITENKTFKFLIKKHTTILIIFTSVLILLGVLVVSIDSYRTYIDNQKFEKQRNAITTEIKFWESTVGKYSNYRDAYFRLAVLNYELKDYGKSKEYLKKVFKIDPNFKEGMEFEGKLQ